MPMLCPCYAQWAETDRSLDGSIAFPMTLFPRLKKGCKNGEAALDNKTKAA
jgi:hypothetical protein